MAHKKEVVENHRDIVKKLEDSLMKLNNSEKSGEHLLGAIQHFNSYNLGKTD